MSFIDSNISILYTCNKILIKNTKISDEMMLTQKIYILLHRLLNLYTKLKANEIYKGIYAKEVYVLRNEIENNKPKWIDYCNRISDFDTKNNILQLCNGYTKYKSDYGNDISNCMDIIKKINNNIYIKDDKSNDEKEQQIRRNAIKTLELLRNAMIHKRTSDDLTIASNSLYSIPPQTYYHIFPCLYMILIDKIHLSIDLIDYLLKYSSHILEKGYRGINPYIANYEIDDINYASIPSNNIYINKEIDFMKDLAKSNRIDSLSFDKDFFVDNIYYISNNLKNYMSNDISISITEFSSLIDLNIYRHYRLKDIFPSISSDRDMDIFIPKIIYKYTCTNNSCLICKPDDDLKYFYENIVFFMHYLLKKYDRLIRIDIKSVGSGTKLIEIFKINYIQCVIKMINLLENNIVKLDDLFNRQSDLNGSLYNELDNDGLSLTDSYSFYIHDGVIKIYYNNI